MSRKTILAVARSSSSEDVADLRRVFITTSRYFGHANIRRLGDHVRCCNVLRSRTIMLVCRSIRLKECAHTCHYLEHQDREQEKHAYYGHYVQLMDQLRGWVTDSSGPQGRVGYRSRVGWVRVEEGFPRGGCGSVRHYIRISTLEE